MTAPVVRIGNLVAVGHAQEADAGTFLAPTVWTPASAIGLERDPHVILPELFHYDRSAYLYAIDGIQTVGGPVGIPLYPDSGNQFLFGALGHDSVGASAGHQLHTAVKDHRLPTFSVLKLLDDLALQFSGLMVQKAVIKLSTKAEAQTEYTFTGLRGEIFTDPIPTPLFGTDVPYGPTGTAINLGLQLDATVTTCDITLDNGSKTEESMTGDDFPVVVHPGTRKVSVKTTVFLQALSGDPTGYFEKLKATGQLKPLVDISATVTQGTNVHTFHLPAAVLVKYSNPLKLGDVIMSDLEWEATVGGGNNTDFEVTLLNDISTAYATAV